MAPVPLVSKKSEYAIAALTELALSPCSPVSSREIAQRQLIPPNLVSQLLSTMAKAGWVRSARGPGGGARLERAPDSISLYDVILLFDGPPTLVRCHAGDLPCPREGICLMHGFWTDTLAGLVNRLRSTSIADIARAGGGSQQSQPPPSADVHQISCPPDDPGLS